MRLLRLPCRKSRFAPSTICGTRVLALAIGLAVSLPLSAPAADAAVVKILTSVKASAISGADADDDLDFFYQGLGATSSLHTGAIVPADLAGVDLLVIMIPDDAFSPGETTAIADFLSAGGDLLVIGEQNGFAATENVFVNDLLSALGSDLSLGNSSIDSGFHNTVPAQIIAQPGFTDGVVLVNYGNVNAIVGVDPGRKLFLASDLSTVWGAYELFGQSRLVLLADVNVISNLEDTAGNDNHVFFANLVDIGIIDTQVKILTSTLAGTIAGGDGDNDLNAFYLSHGVTSSLWSTLVSAEALAGAELLVVMLPDDEFTTEELTAMGDFLAAGHRILFLGEQEVFAAPQNARIDAALAALGSSMSLDAVSLDDEGLQDTVPGQILLHPFTDGVSVLNYGNVNSISGVPGSAGSSGPLFLAKNFVSVWGAAEALAGGGEIVLVADTNLISNLEDEAGNDNHVFFLNAVPVCVDADADGYCAASDCDDANPDCALDCTDVDLDGICANLDCDDAVPSSGSTVFVETLSAPDRNRVVWSTPTDVRWRKGALEALGGPTGYDAIGAGTLRGAVSLDTSADEPSPGNGVYYLVREQGCGSWQTSLGAQPGRDADLPLP